MLASLNLNLIRMANSLQIPGSDPVGGFAISIIATLLSLLKRDPLSLFGGGLGGLPLPLLVKRDVPHLADRVPELSDAKYLKRQFSTQTSVSNSNTGIATSLPSFSQGLPGVGIGSLPLSGVTGKNSAQVL